MKRFFLGYALIVAVMVTLGGIGLLHAQQPAEQTITLTVTTAEVQSIGKGLGTLPYGEVAALMIKLQTQINNQVKPPEAKAEEKPAAPK